MRKKKDRTSFAARLRELREAAGLTQAELADRAGLNQDTLSNWERGHRVPNVASLPILVDALGASLDDLLRVPATDTEKRPRGRPRKPKDAAAPAPTKPRGRRKRKDGAE